ALSHFKRSGSVSKRLDYLSSVARCKVSSGEPQTRATLLEAYCGAFCCLRSCLSFIRALWSCDLLVPTEQPKSRATSSCSCPSTSCRTNTARYPGGNCDTALSSAILSTTGIRFGFSVPLSACCTSPPSSLACSTRTPFRRKCIKTWLTVRRCSHVVNRDSPRKLPTLR